LQGMHAGSFGHMDGNSQLPQCGSCCAQVWHSHSHIMPLYHGENTGVDLCGQCGQLQSLKVCCNLLPCQPGSLLLLGFLLGVVRCASVEITFQTSNLLCSGSEKQLAAV
jgi:hypothetical protein